MLVYYTRLGDDIMEKTAKTYYDAINNYISGKSKDMYDIYMLGSKKAIMLYLKEFLELNPNKHEKIKYMVENLDSLLKSKYTSEHFVKILKHKLETNAAHTPKNCFYAYKVLTAPKEEVVEVVRKMNLGKAKYEEMINYLERKFPNQTNEYNYLRFVYDVYEKKYNKKESPRAKTYIIRKDLTKTIDKCALIEEVYNSGLSKEEFCFKTGVPFSNINEALKLRNPKYTSLIEEISSRDSSHIEKEINSIIYDILTTPDFDILDYLDRTKLTYNDLKRYLPSGLTPMQHKKINDIFVPIKKRMSSSRKTILDTKLNRNNREITREEKENIFAYIDEKGYPDVLYSMILNKYLEGEIDINNKQLIKENF